MKRNLKEKILNTKGINESKVNDYHFYDTEDLIDSIFDDISVLD